MTIKKLTEAKKAKYTEADFVWDEKAMVAEYKAAVLDYVNGASMDEALKVIKALLKSAGDTVIKGKGRMRESTSTKITKTELKEMIREALREELASSQNRKVNSRLKESSGTPEFKIVYSFGKGPTETCYLYADNENDARDLFLDDLAEKGEIMYDGDVNIVRIEPTGNTY
jgi:hypothetical protein